MEETTIIEESPKLTEEQIKKIEKAANDVVEESDDLKAVAELPSNNGKEERSELEASQDKGEYKMAQVQVDPNNGENKIIGTIDEDDEIATESFDDFCKRIENEDITEKAERPITEDEMSDYIRNNKDKDGISNITDSLNLSDDDIRIILNITNRKMNHEDFNIYKELPESVQKIITKYMEQGNIPVLSNEGKAFRNSLADALIQEFITNITANRIQTDFAKEIEDIYDNAASDISEAVTGYTKEKNKQFREAVEKIDDPEKKEKLSKLVDKIDEAFNLNELKEFAKTCRIKRIEIEKPDRCFNRFINKYKSTKYNIYDIHYCIPILARNINLDDTTRYNVDDIVAFLDVFCKQTMNMYPSNAEEMVYMYFFIHNIVIIDLNSKNKKDSHGSDDFIKNVQSVIDVIKARNSNLLK